MQPENLKETFCRLCLNTIRDTNCKIRDNIRDFLEIVSPVVNLAEKDKNLICEVCSVKLFGAFNFKSMCMDTENIIFPYISASKVSVIDLKEVYLKEKANTELNDILEDQRICRLCFHLVTNGFVSLNEVNVDIINIYLPQLKVSATNDPVICGPCFDSLHTHGDFLKECLDARKKYKSTDNESVIKFEETELKLEDDQDGQEEYKSIDKDIKPEEIEIKGEEDAQDGSSRLFGLFI
ncbi:uncharacterized protein LOC108913529 isoform X3 [Anoplophora glabripennis]|uniref:uncharacterized protein LOC108913529 isoform X3 n=1 Tax=Anoplophora glabripennis TaxID=217634 RepID=UPI000C77AA77|nr:uncharacterized protein LOC108913529 isoform X3 [Anoplophora glabripennis]